MSSYLRNLVLFWFIILYLSLLFILPYELFTLGINTEICPAFDLIGVYYFSTYRRVTIRQSFIIGLILDPLYNMSPGTNSLILITGSFLLNYASKLIILKDYLYNWLGFTVYALLITVLRYIGWYLRHDAYFIDYTIYFYLLTTFLAYPALKVLIHKPLQLLR